MGAHRENAEGRIAFLKIFDVNFRRRRLRFLVRCVNDAYASFAFEQPTWRPLLDQVKKGLLIVDFIRNLREVQSGRWVKDPEHKKLHEELEKLFGREALKGLMEDAAAAMASEAGVADGATTRARRRLDARLDDYLRRRIVRSSKPPSICSPPRSKGSSNTFGSSSRAP